MGNPLVTVVLGPQIPRNAPSFPGLESPIESSVVTGCDTFGHRQGKICWQYELSGKFLSVMGVAVTWIVDSTPNSWLAVRSHSMLLTAVTNLKMRNLRFD